LKEAIAEFLTLGEELLTRVNTSLDLIAQCHLAVADGHLEEAQTIDLTPISQAIQEYTGKYNARYYQYFGHFLNREG